MAETAYGNVTPTRRLVGGERFNVTVERHVPLAGMSRIDTVSEAYDKVGQSRYFYVITPTRAAIATGDQRVGTFGVRARLAEATNLPVSVGAAIQDMGIQLGFMRIRQVESVDAKAAASVEAQAKQTAQEREEGAGQTTLEKAVSGVKDAGTAAKTAFAQTFGIVKLAVVAALAVGVFLVLREARQ